MSPPDQENPDKEPESVSLGDSDDLKFTGVIRYFLGNTVKGLAKVSKELPPLPIDPEAAED